MKQNHQAYFLNNNNKIFLSREFNLVGRNHNCDIILSHMSISKEHAAIQIDKEYNYTLNDLNSVNGSFVNNIKVKTKILKNQDAIVFGKDKENVYVFYTGGSQDTNSIMQSNYQELDKKIQVLDLNMNTKLVNPLQNQFKQKLDNNIIQENMTNDQKNFNLEQGMAKEKLQEQILEREEKIIIKEGKMREIQQENEMVIEEKEILFEQLKALKEYCSDLQKRLDSLKEKEREQSELITEMNEASESKEKVIELRRIENELRRALWQKDGESQFYKEQLQKGGEEGQVKLIEQLQRELFESRGLNEEYENRQNSCNRQWTQLINENYQKQQKIEGYEQTVEMQQKDSQQFYQQCEQKQAMVNQQLLDVMDTHNNIDQQGMAAQLLVNEMNSVQEENLYLHEEYQRLKAVNSQQQQQINQMEENISRQQNRQEQLDKLDELNDLVYELRHSDGAIQVVQLKDSNSQLHLQISLLQKQLNTFRQDTNMKTDQNGFVYDEKDVLAYFTALIQSKDTKIQHLMVQLKNQQKGQKDNNLEQNRLKDEIAFLRKQQNSVSNYLQPVRL